MSRLEAQLHKEMELRSQSETLLKAQLNTQREKAEKLQKHILSLSQQLEVKRRENAQLQQVVDQIQGETSRQVIVLQQVNISVELV